MIALFIVLNATDYLDDILAKFIELGVRGATILESQGMARAIVHEGYENIPLFGSLKMMLSDSHPYNKTIVTVLKDELLNKTVTAIKEVLLDIKGNDIGFMFTVPVGEIFTFGHSKK